MNAAVPAFTLGPMNHVRTFPQPPYNPEFKASRAPSKKKGGDPLRPVSAVSINIFDGSGGSMGSLLRKPAEIRHFEAINRGTPPQMATGFWGSRRIDFAAVNDAALHEFPALLARWLPDGRANGREYEARNPRRADRNPGSFRVNMRTGRWSDFATGDRGGDPVSLAAFLFDLTQIETARRLAAMLGVS